MIHDKFFGGSPDSNMRSSKMVIERDNLDFEESSEVSSSEASDTLDSIDAQERNRFMLKNLSANEYKLYRAFLLSCQLSVVTTSKSLKAMIIKK